MKHQMFALAASALVLAGAAQAETIRVAGNFATDHSSSVAMESFAATLTELSGGAFEVNLFPARQLGGAAENVQAVKLGAVQIVWVGTAYLTRTVPELEIVGLPFQFESREEAFGILDGPVGEALDEKLAAQDIMSLGYMELGFRQMTNSVRPIETLEDIAGLKIRLQPNETHLATFRALGANPLAMDVNELYSALEQKVVDGQENPFSIIQVAGYPEVQEYVSNTGHFFDFISVVANKDWFDGLSAEQQGWVTQAMDMAVAEQRKLAEEQDGAALDKIIEMGMTYTEVSPELAAALRATVAGVAAETKARLDPALVALLDAEMSAVSN